MMASVDVFLSDSEDGEYYMNLKRETESGQYVAIRTWNGQAHKTGGVNLQHHCTIIGFWWRPQHYSTTQLLFLEPGVDLPALEIEFVGTVCGTHQYVNDYFQVGNALPVRLHRR